MLITKKPTATTKINDYYNNGSIKYEFYQYWQNRNYHSQGFPSLPLLKQPLLFFLIANPRLTRPVPLFSSSRSNHLALLALKQFLFLEIRPKL